LHHNNNRPQGGEPKLAPGKNYLLPYGPCPIHPKGNHTWGECLSNAYGKNAKMPASSLHGSESGKPKESKVDANKSKQGECYQNKTKVTFEANTDSNPSWSDPISQIEGKQSPSDSCVQHIAKTYQSSHHYDTCFTVHQNISRVSRMTLPKPNFESASPNSGTPTVMLQSIWPLPGEPKVLSTLEWLQETVECLYDEEEPFVNEIDEDLEDLKNICTNVPTPKVVFKPNLQLCPVSFLTVEMIQGKCCCLPFKCLFDPGSDSSFITAKAVPRNCNWERVKSLSFWVLGGVAPTTHQVHLKNIALPEFSHLIHTSHSFWCYINHDNDCPYDIILGLDFLTPVGIDVMCLQQKVRLHPARFLMKGVVFLLFVLFVKLHLAPCKIIVCCV
jgi:hypothetical protein